VARQQPGGWWPLPSLLDNLTALWRAWADAGETLPGHAWEAGTRLPGWDVRALYAHAGQWPAGLRRFARRTVDDMPQFVSGGSLLAFFNRAGGAATGLAASLAEFSRQDASEHSVAQLVARFAAAGPAGLAAVSRLAADDCLEYAGGLRVSVRSALEVGVVEATVHLLDFVEAADRVVPGGVSDPPAEALLVTRDVLAAVPDPKTFVEAATGRVPTPVFPVMR
jgi:hypothetical protein